MNGSMSELSKMTVVNVLLQSFYPARFLELSTPLTGHEFKRTRTELCARADLAKYRVQDLSEAGGGPDDADIEDGSSSSDRLLDSVLTGLGGGPKYDVILCDPYHSYAESLNDLRNAWLLLVPGGTLVVHDCNPATAQHASPLQRDGIWCGRTFEAFLDFVRQVDLPYFTIDADYGIGVIRKDGGSYEQHPFDSLFKTMTPAARVAWDSTSPEGDRFLVFEAQRTDLLNLVTEEAFVTHWSEVRPVGGVSSSTWTRARSQTEIIGRYEEMVSRWETTRRPNAQTVDSLRARVDRQQKLTEEQGSVITIAELEVQRLGEHCRQAELRYDGAQTEQSESRDDLRLARAELAERDLRVAELEKLIFERTSEFLSPKSRATVWLRAVALWARFRLVRSPTGVAAIARHRPPRS